MPLRQVTISTLGGAHARPVAELARLAMAHPAPVTLATATGAVVELASILAVMDLALTEGDVVVLETPASPDADAVLDAMAEVLAPR
ncbi:HPr family phosphocarrier protein [Microbacterium sp. CIAB417]|uniref:HPr family phosphocarrier protein n=1 Tax=Microbacterium sp. CIAB417 TaxID=2860287 RepID=UPI001FABE633|nr:HPr family phosphocarrier protein [Microbacterium sp. CIAB417]